MRSEDLLKSLRCTVSADSGFTLPRELINACASSYFYSSSTIDWTYIQANYRPVLPGDIEPKDTGSLIVIYVLSESDQKSHKAPYGNPAIFAVAQGHWAQSQMQKTGSYAILRAIQSPQPIVGASGGMSIAEVQQEKEMLAQRMAELTKPRADNIAPSKAKVDLVDVIYCTTNQKFYFLMKPEQHNLLEEEKLLNKPMQQLQGLLKAGNYQSGDINSAKQSISEVLRYRMTNANQTELAEIIHLGAPAWGYVKADLLDTFQYTADHSQYLAENDSNPFKPLSQKLKKPADVELNLVYQDYQGNFITWGKSLIQNIDATLFQSPNFTATDASTIMRYAMGTSVTGSYEPATQAFSFSPKNDETITLASASMTCKGYFPSKSGVEVTLSDLNGENLDLGKFLAYIEMDLSAFAGASTLLCTKVEVDLGDEGSEIKGNEAAKSPDGIVLKTDQNGNTNGSGVHIESSAFVGVQGGCDLTGELQWASPETIISPCDQSKANEAIVGPGAGEAAFKTLASVSGGAMIAAGVGRDVAFKITYDIEKEQFHIVCAAALVWGYGAGGQVGLTIDAGAIETFVEFVYHQLKNNNYSITGLFTDLAYQALTGIIAVAVWAGDNLKNYAKQGLNNAEQWLGSFSQEENTLAGMQGALINNILENEQLVKFAPPETKGRWLFQLCQSYWLSGTYWQDDWTKGQAAVALILSYIQSRADYDIVMQNMVPLTADNIGEPVTTISALEGKMILWQSEGSMVYIGGQEAIVYNEEQAAMAAKMQAKANALYQQAYRDTAMKNANITKLSFFGF